MKQVTELTQYFRQQSILSSVIVIFKIHMKLQERNIKETPFDAAERFGFFFYTFNLFLFFFLNPQKQGNIEKIHCLQSNLK